MEEKETKGTVVHIQGGLGKCIAFTAVAKCFKETYPDLQLVVISGYPEVFLHNPNIDGNFEFSQHGLWFSFYSNPDFEIMAFDPYFHQDWINNSGRHLTDIWCELLDVECKGSLPQLYFSGPEVEELKRMMNVDRPLLVVQSTGGPNPGAVSWTRNPPTQELDDYLAKYSDSHYIVHLCQQATPVLKSVNQRIDGLNRRQAMCLVYYAQEFVGIDSFGLHARAANPNSGPSTFFFPLPEIKDKLGYKETDHNYILPTEQVQDLLKGEYAYYATLQRFAIDEPGVSCPVPAGIRWFDY